MNKKLDFFREGGSYDLMPDMFAENDRGLWLPKSLPKQASAGGGGGGQMNLYQQNMVIRNLWVMGRPDIGMPPAVDMWQQLFPSLPATITTGTTLTIFFRNVGLIKRLLLRFNFRAKAGSTSTQNLTPLGLANFVSNVTLTDLANNQRINTTGWHLTALSSMKRRRPFGAAMITDTPFGYGNNYIVQRAPASIAANGTSNCCFILEIPLARNDQDLRGAMFGDVTSASAQVTVTLNPNMFVASTADPTSAMFQSAGSDLGSFDNFTLEVVQNYLDQGPRTQQGVLLLPQLDIGTAYMLTQVATPGAPVVNQQNTAPFVNQRQFLSLMFGFDNQALNAGTDLTTVGILSANFTQVMQYSPYIQAFRGRVGLGADLPTGFYFMDFNDRPIDTAQYGNMQFQFQPSSVAGSASTGLLAYEAFGIIGLVNQGGSIPSGA